jgi:hypothetical protein
MKKPLSPPPTARLILIPVQVVLLLITTLSAPAQNLQLHYDLRHTLSPSQNPQNFLTLYFEYFKKQDSGHSFFKPGSFLLKTEADLFGANNNIGKFFLQVSQSFRFWEPKIFLCLQYSGGGGITEPKQYSYYIPNTFSAGAEYPFQWKDTYFTSQLSYRYTPYQRPSHDFLYTLYWWKGLLNYKLEVAGDLSIWTGNKDHGDAVTAGQKGKRFFFFAEPQVWYYLTKRLAAGSKLNLYYHVNTPENLLQPALTIAMKCKL